MMLSIGGIGGQRGQLPHKKGIVGHCPPPPPQEIDWMTNDPCLVAIIYNLKSHEMKRATCTAFSDQIDMA